MYSSKDLQSLLKLSEQSKKTLEIELEKNNKIAEEVLKNAPVEDRKVLEMVKALTNKAIVLAKEGKQAEANEVINEIKNLR